MTTYFAMFVTMMVPYQLTNENKDLHEYANGLYMIIKLDFSPPVC